MLLLSIYLLGTSLFSSTWPIAAEYYNLISKLTSTIKMIVLQIQEVRTICCKWSCPGSACMPRCWRISQTQISKLSGHVCTWLETSTKLCLSDGLDHTDTAWLVYGNMVSRSRLAHAPWLSMPEHVNRPNTGDWSQGYFFGFWSSHAESCRWRPALNLLWVFSTSPSN